MPEEAKSPVYMRVAEGAYGAMFSATKRSEILEAMEQWADDELFILAHLAYLKLQALEAVRLQNERIIALLEDIKADTDELAAVAEELGEEDFGEEPEEELTGDVSFEEDGDGSSIAPGSSVFEHPIPLETPDRGEE